MDKLRCTPLPRWLIAPDNSKCSWLPCLLLERSLLLSLPGLSPLSLPLLLVLPLPLVLLLVVGVVVVLPPPSTSPTPPENLKERLGTHSPAQGGVCSRNLQRPGGLTSRPLKGVTSVSHSPTLRLKGVAQRPISKPQALSPCADADGPCCFSRCCCCCCCCSDWRCWRCCCCCSACCCCCCGFWSRRWVRARCCEGGWCWC